MPKRYLITGVAGSGKSTLEKVFREKSYSTVDIDEGFANWRHADTDELLEYTPDEPGWHEVAEWAVDIEKLQAFFANHPDDPVLVFGSFARMRQVVPLFDRIFLLDYPNAEVARRRIAEREGGYGKHPDELVRILSYVEFYRQKMKAFGAEVIDCTLSVAEIARMIEKRIGEDG